MEGLQGPGAHEALRDLRGMAFRIKNDANGSVAQAVERSNFVETVVSNVKRFGSQKELLIGGMQVLTDLAGKEWGGRVLQREGTPQAVAAVVMRGLRDSDKHARLVACRAVNALASRQPGYDEALGAAGACHELLKVRQEFGADPSVWKVVLDATAAMARSHDGNRQAFRRRAEPYPFHRRSRTLWAAPGLLDVLGPREALHALADGCFGNAAGLEPYGAAIVAELRAFADKGCCTCSWDTSLPCQQAADKTGLATVPALGALAAVLQASDPDARGGRTRACCMAVQSLAGGCAVLARTMATGQVLEGVARLLDISVPVSVWSSACMAVGALSMTGCIPDGQLGRVLHACQSLWAQRLRHFVDDPEACSALCCAVATLVSNGPCANGPVALQTCEKIVGTMGGFAGDRRMAVIGCYAVAALAESLIKAGAFEAVASAMRNFSSDYWVCLLGCEAIETLAQMRTVSPEPLALRKGARAVVVAMQAFPQDGRVRCRAFSALRYLAEQGGAGVRAVAQAGACATLVNAMRASLSVGSFDVAVFASACRVVAALARFENKVAEMVGARACEALLEGVSACLWLQDQSVCERVCTAKAALLTGRDDIREAMGRLGICEAVAAVLRTLRSKSATQAGLRVVVALSEGTPNHQDAMRAAGACEAVVAALRGFKKAVRVRVAALKAVRVLSKGMSSNQHAMRQAGACEAVVAAVEAHQGVAAVALAGLEAVVAVSDCMVSNQNAMRRAGACEAVTATMQSFRECPEVTAAGLEAISSLTRGHLANSMALWQAGAGVEVVAAAPAQVPDAAACVRYCQAVALLTAYHVGNRAALGFRKVYRAVRGAMRTYPMERDVQVWGCMAVAGLACRDMDNKARFSSLDAGFESGLVLANFPQDAEACEGACQALYSLALWNKDYLTELMDDAPGQTVLTAVSNHTADPDVSLWACRLIAVMAGASRLSQGSLAAAGACDYVPQVLARYCDSDRDVCDAACRALLSLARDSPDNQAAMRAAGACEPVVKVLRAAIAKGQRTLCLVGCDAVRALAAEGSEAQAELQVFMACEAVMEALWAFPLDAIVGQRACGAMAALANRHAGCQEALGRAGGCEAVHGGLQAFGSDRLVSQACCAALGALARGHAENQERLATLGTCGLVVSVLQMSLHWPGARKPAMRMVKALAEGIPSNQSIMGAAGACQMVLAVVQDSQDDAEVRVAALEAVVALSKGMPSNKHAMRQAGACEVLVATLQVLFPDAEVTTAALIAVAVVCDDMVSNQNAMRRAGACREVVRFVRAFHHDQGPSIASLAAICNLAVSNPANKMALGEAGACGEVVGLAHTLEAYEASCALLSKAVAMLALGNPRNAALLGERGGCMAVLSMLRRHKTGRDMQAWGCLAVATLAERDMDNKTAFNTAGGR